MNNFINPIDSLIAVIILAIVAIGVNSGAIIESKKNITIILSSFISSFIFHYVKIINSDTMNFLLFTIMLIVFLFIIGFICDLVLRIIPAIHIDKDSDKLVGGILGLCKGLIIISILIFSIELIPIQENLKDKLFNKAKKDSTLFNVCDKIKDFVIY